MPNYSVEMYYKIIQFYEDNTGFLKTFLGKKKKLNKYVLIKEGLDLVPSSTHPNKFIDYLVEVGCLERKDDTLQLNRLKMAMYIESNLREKVEHGLRVHKKIMDFVEGEKNPLTGEF